MVRDRHHGLMSPIKRRLQEYAERSEQAEYTGEVEERNPLTHIVVSLTLWGLVTLAGNQLVQHFAPTWVAAVIAIPWLIISGFAVRIGQARYHGLSLPEYSDYIDKATERHQTTEDRDRARQLERKINSDIQELDNMDVVESVAVWGDGVEVELKQRMEDYDSDQ